MIDVGLMEPPVATDSRIYLGWQSTARAMLLAKGNAHLENQTINATQLSEVAPLGLGSLAYLSREGKDFFQETWGTSDRLTPMEAAIGARWIIASIAAKQRNPLLTEKEHYAHLDKYSYGTLTDQVKKEQASGALYKRVVRGERPESTNNHDAARTSSSRRRA